MRRRGWGAVGGRRYDSLASTPAVKQQKVAGDDDPGIFSSENFYPTKKTNACLLPGIRWKPCACHARAAAAAGRAVDAGSATGCSGRDGLLGGGGERLDTLVYAVRVRY